MKENFTGKNTAQWSGFLWGVAAVLLWSLLAAFSRSLREMLGMFTSGGCIYILGGLLCFILYPPKKRKFIWKYHGLCGFLVVAYFILYSAGIGLARNHAQAVEMNLINYMWPMLTLVFSIFMFKKKISFLLLVSGMMLSFFGLAFSSSVLSGVALTPSGLWNNFCTTPVPYLMMAGAAVSWGFYSNILASFNGKVPPDGLPYFMIAGGLIMFALRFPFHETSVWSMDAVWKLAITALLPGCAGYYCWDRSMQSGNTTSAIIFSYMTPLFSAICCAVFLKVNLPWTFYGACLAVIAGALLCRASIRKNACDAMRL